MTEKEKQAKLQYLLNSLSMTKEQKDIVVELVNSSGSGAPTKDVIAIKLNEEGNDVVVFRNDIELFSCNINGSFDNQTNTTLYTSNELYNFFNNNFDNDFVIVRDITNIGDSDLHFVANAMNKLKSATAVGFSFIDIMNVIYGIGFQKEQ